MSLFMVVEHFRNGRAAPVYRRLVERRMARIHALRAPSARTGWLP